MRVSSSGLAKIVGSSIFGLILSGCSSQEIVQEKPVLAYVSGNSDSDCINTISEMGEKKTIVKSEHLSEPWLSWSPDGKELAYVADDSLVVVDSNGQNRRQVTKGRNVQFVSWSPDGKHILYSDSENDMFQIFSVDAQGIDRRILTSSGSNYSPCWSGEKIVFQSKLDKESDWEICIMDSDGSNVRKLTDNDVDDEYPNTSGNNIVFGSERKLYTIGSDGQNKRLVFNPSNLGYEYARCRLPVWSPAGENIAFQLRTRDLSELWVVTSDGRAKRKLSKKLLYADPLMSWSPDGKKIAFESETENEFRIKSTGISVVNVDGSDERVIAPDNNIVGHPFPVYRK